MPRSRRGLWGTLLLCLAVCGVVLLTAYACANRVTVTLPPRPQADIAVRREAVGHASVVITPKQVATPVAGVAQVLLSPSDVSVLPGQKVIFTAMALDAAGKRTPSGTLRWQVLDARAGQIDPRGIFTAGLTPGVYQNVVSVQIVSGERTIEGFASIVIAEQKLETASLETLSVYPSKIAAQPGQVVGLGTIGWDTRSRFIPDLKVEWNVRTPNAGNVDSQGFFTASRNPGDYPDAIEVVATDRSPRGPVKRSAFVSVSIAEGLPSGGLDRVVVVPGRIEATPGHSVSLFTRAFNRTGQRLDGIEFSWTLAEPDAGELPRPEAFVVGHKPGIYRGAIIVVGTQRTPGGTLTATAAVDVIVKEPQATEAPNLLAAAQVTPGTITLNPGAAFAFVGRGIDASGKSVPVNIAWSMRNPDAGAFEDSGLFKASLTPGIYPDAIALELTQELGGRTARAMAFATVNIVGPLERVEVVPPTVNVQAGQAVQLTARGYDALGLEVSGLTFKWRLEDRAAGVIDNSGLFTAGALPGVFENAITVVAAKTGPE